MTNIENDLTIPCEKTYRNGCENYLLDYDSKQIRIEKDLHRDRYIRVFVDEVLVSREKETEKKVEIRIEGKSKNFFLEYWYKSKLSIWLGKAFFGVGATINKIPVDHTVAAAKVQLSSGRLAIFFFTALMLTRLVLVFLHPTIIAGMGGGHQLPIEAPLYFFLLYLLTVYLFTYAQNPARAIAGTFFIGVIETSAFLSAHLLSGTLFLLGIIFLYMRLIALRSLWVAWRANSR